MHPVIIKAVTHCGKDQYLKLNTQQTIPTYINNAATSGS
jgi:hypothetical protein